MTGPKMDQGLVRVGHIVATDEDDDVVSATFDDKGIEVIWPRALSFTEAWERNEARSTPDTMIFRDHSGYLTFREGSSGGLSMSTVGSSQQRLRFRSAIETGHAGIDYAAINGMSSEVEGLADWAKLHPVRGRVEFEGIARIPRVVITAENLESHSLGGPLALSLETSFTHSPVAKGGVYSISETLTLQTRSTDLVPWEQHAATHHMLQDLMCLVYGHPRRAWLRAVMREDDQQFGTEDDRRWWPNVYEPTFGRTPAAVKNMETDRRPLFYLDESDPARVANWLSEFKSWSRPTWIAVTTLFQSNSTVEAQLLQVGIALEALGYALWRRGTPVGGRTPRYESLLERVTVAVGIEHRLLYGDGRTANDWRREFNAVFRGAKHADNPLPDSVEALVRARQGFMLIRCWLAVELGVSAATLSERLDSHQSGRW